MTLDSNHSDSMRKGLIRLFQRNLLDDSAATAGLRRAVENRDADVRKTAFLISVLSRPALSKALRERDKDLNRQLEEIEKFEIEGVAIAGSASTKKSTKKSSPKKAR